MDYLYLKDIRIFMKSYYEQHKKGISVFSAIKELRAQQKVRSGEFCMPDFASWHTDHLDEFIHLAEYVPISVEEAAKTQEIFFHHQDAYALSENAPVQIALESIYAPKTFQILPYITVYYVLRGTCLFVTEQAQYTVSTGSLLILPPHMPFYLFCTENDIVIQIITNESIFKSQLSEITGQDDLLAAFFFNVLKGRRDDFLSFILPPNEQLLDIIKHLFIEFLSNEAFSTEVFTHYLQIFYIQILRNCNKEQSHHPHSKQHLTIFPAVLLYIQNNFRTVTLTSLSTHFNYSVAYLSRLIKKETGKTFSEILLEIRLKHAMQLLLDTTLTVTYIAELSGYQSANHFTHSFKQHTGQSPNQYRKNMRLP